jgi:hypothetical protein
VELSERAFDDLRDATDVCWKVVFEVGMDDTERVFVFPDVLELSGAEEGSFLPHVIDRQRS